MMTAQSGRAYYRQTAKAFQRECAKRLTQPMMIVKPSGKHTIDLHDVNGIPWMVGCPTYLVDMSATVTLSTSDTAVVDMRKFFKSLG